MHVGFRIFFLEFFSQFLEQLQIAGIQEMLERVAKEKGLEWDSFFEKLKKGEQWHVEVY